MIEILSTSALNTIQDFGRPHALHMGVSRGGAMDRLAIAHANILLGNARDAAALEIAFFPFRARFVERTAFSLTGASCAAQLDGRPIPSNWAMTAEAGQVLVVPAPTCGAWAYFGIRGGLDVPVVLGARGTDLKGGFGGVDGRAPEKGRRLKAGCSSVPPPGNGGFGLVRGAVLPEDDHTVLRVLPAAEHEAFTSASRTAFGELAWQVTPRANRTGFRMDGRDALRLSRPLTLMSHGIVPGTVQVPPDGMPIIQMADANTCGGYPKIATVIESDLRLLAQTAIGGSVRFVPVDEAGAIAVLREEARALDCLEADVERLRGGLLD
ncbi:hypothetical protein GLI01_36180 [Gluconacetobacter liquefaciens]|uniref:Biotin-dependent carboxylase-like uncharacterized protein n=1 Tax=Gluconacetobacter liquefaciens TaxID=89584 RepID=A0A370FZB6_GLULI|nr:biotin-dependent carboxyltransferase family protein [Gluconacetobacter liquefaciens]MBB2187317.1 biotin-dependent carboxyltransferase family protein [Gluconacetobacter liquefaciens]RDI36872.1 biotin-dependent carboxylase-like uncharacterized protein [Gluconacetobacter liquefaciens]GBQ93644.1 allophanate hydrolase subunit 2 [Gluconacetobacter liquefaciens NRIC 0522]GEB39583.1 hypothetical protein GLI01_36180 [Gluconacetobacter liquefaciens]